jgi:ATP phosphoribosyltransferase
MSAMIKLALPAGDMRGEIARILDSAGLSVEGYGEGSRAYRLSGRSRETLTARVFREKDIPVQVALGNYDLGICSIGWVREIYARFPSQPIVPLADLGIGRSTLWAAGAKGQCDQLEDLSGLGLVRIASEYGNIAEAFARSARVSRFRVQPVWGAAEAYPPEDADCAIFSAPDEAVLREAGVKPLFEILEDSAWLIANATALATRDLGSVIGPLIAGGVRTPGGDGLRLPGTVARHSRERTGRQRDSLRMAIPDGHQQRHVVGALHEAGLTFDGYGDGVTIRRPSSGIDELEVKVIRPHDMPSLIATGEMDLAITGRDCLMEHRYAFPSTPVVEIVDLKRGQYNLSAVVNDDLPASTIHEAVEHWRDEGKPLVRVASEFPAIADHYARSMHFWRYQVIPIAGASEGFVPEDADLLIEGTETGKTLAENNLKAIDLLYRSTTCVIARRDRQLSGRRQQLFDEIVAALEDSVRATEAV